MKRGEGACLVCGQPLQYFREAREMECSVCHGKFKSYASCKQGHYVCDACHEKKGLEAVMRECGESGSKDPIHIIQTVMQDPYLYMHGPEHHVLVGTALLTITRAGSLTLRPPCGKWKRGEADIPAGHAGCGAAAARRSARAYSSAS